MKKKILITAGVITIIIILLTILQGKVNAATLQSNPNTHYKTKDTSSNWIKNIRTMESSGGAMGLSETVNDDQTFKESSNNIDVHMMRNTEYGAIAILSVSGYGNSKNIQNSTIQSTTGNETGIYYTSTGKDDKEHPELVAGGLSDGFPKISKKYYDEYTTSSSSIKIGDALDLQWQGTLTKDWLKYDSNEAYRFGRNWKGYFGYSTFGLVYNTPGYSRGVAICGTGF